MPSKARLKKTNRTIKRGPKKLNFGVSKPGVGGGRAPRAPPLDPLVKKTINLLDNTTKSTYYRRTCHAELRQTWLYTKFWDTFPYPWGRLSQSPGLKAIFCKCNPSGWKGDLVGRIQ